MRMTKEQIRKILREKRKKQTIFKKTKSDQKICTALEKLQEFQNAKSVLFYQAIEPEGEITVTGLIKKYIHKKKILLPRSNHKKNELEICQIQDLTNLEIGRHGIREPQKHCTIIHPSKIDLVIVPGIAFDMKGYGIGFGKGFYDRFLKKISCPVIALAYNFQIVQSIPGEKHDMKINTIVTEKEVIHFTTS